MKIGIMTCWWSEDNYGQILQCYALQKYLRDVGHDTYLIRYDPRNDYIKTTLSRKIIKALNPVILYKFLLNKKRKIVDKNEKKNNSRKFDDFRNKHIKQSERTYCSYNELVENPPEADIYIAGSDQIWNSYNVPIDRAINKTRAFMLDFGNTTIIKRIAYAASFGKKQLNNDSIEIFTPLLKKFDYISVREKSGLNICKQCGIDNAEWVPDPTMLLDVDKYRALYNDETIVKPAKPYCFLYLLGNEYNFPVKAVCDWAEKNNIDVLYVSGNSQHDKYKKKYVTIPEWIFLIEHAEYVLTNSYHCVILSLLFKKRFGVIPLSGCHIGMNSRFDSLFELFQITNRFIDIDLSILSKDINWQTVENVFQFIKKSCKLNNIIAEEKNNKFGY